MTEMMRFEQVKKTFTDGQETITALKETSFTIYAGELVAVVGPSGSGKSTLLTLMGGLQTPTAGQIYFREENVSQMSQQERSDLRFDQIGFILQASNLVPFLTLAEQFELVDRLKKEPANRQKAVELMKKFDILQREKQYPADLSGGERQRAAIARALYPDPDLILADEPTASLDTERAMTVVQLLQSISKESQRTTVMVTHDERLLSYCDRVFRIVDGQLAEEDVDELGE